MKNPQLKERLLSFQKAELTEHLIYKKLSLKIKDPQNKKLLEKISQEELAHAQFFKDLTGQDISPSKFKVFFYVFVARVLGLTFGIKLMEKGEGSAQKNYKSLIGEGIDIKKIIEDEERHENQLINLIDEERLKYVSSMVLGLNDALVELSGALAGLSLALQKTKLVAIVGLITGIAASLSMSASEYLSTQQEEGGKSPLKASLYTGFVYILTVLILISPYFIFKNVFFCLALVVVFSILIIYVFTFYISLAKDLSFKKRFLEMALISLTIAGINFFIGFLIRKVFGLEV